MPIVQSSSRCASSSLSIVLPTVPLSKRTTRCGLRTFIYRQSSSQTKSSPHCRLRCIYSTVSSPMPSHCGLRCSRSPGGVRARCAHLSSARRHWASPHRPVVTSCRFAWPRSRRRSSAIRRSLSSTTRWRATRPDRDVSTLITCCSREESSTCLAMRTSVSRSAYSGSRAFAARSLMPPRQSTTSGGPPTSIHVSMRGAPSGSLATSRGQPLCFCLSASHGRSNAISVATER